MNISKNDWDRRRLRIWVSRIPALDSVSLLPYVKGIEEGSFEYIKDVIFESCEDYKGPSVEAGLIVSREATQELMDNLWLSGFRPTDMGDTAGAMKAASEHIKDLREMIQKLFGLLDNEKRVDLPMAFVGEINENDCKNRG